MSSPPKRTSTETWNALVDQAATDEIERILALSDDELDRELSGTGFDPRTVRARGEAIGEAAKRIAGGEAIGEAAKRIAGKPDVRDAASRAIDPRAGDGSVRRLADVVDLPVAKKRRRLVALVSLLAAAAGVLVCVGLAGSRWTIVSDVEPTSPVGSTGAAPPTVPSRTVPPPGVPSRTVPPPGVPSPTADELRRAASVACEAGRWPECRGLLDQARQIDPAGEGTPQVQRLRNAVKSERSLER
jgi:hypothetical protein